MAVREENERNASFFLPIDVTVHFEKAAPRSEIWTKLLAFVFRAATPGG